MTFVLDCLVYFGLFGLFRSVLVCVGHCWSVWSFGPFPDSSGASPGHIGQFFQFLTN